MIRGEAERFDEAGGFDGGMWLVNLADFGAHGVVSGNFLRAFHDVRAAGLRAGGPAGEGVCESARDPAFFAT